MMSSPERKRIVVLGGGIASLSTVFELTSQPNWKDRYDITVYQQGHRLGGKCSSARARYGEVERIEEHGLHVFFGFYENAFDMMRRTYAELDGIAEEEGEKRLALQDAFLPRDMVLLGDDKTRPLRSWTLLFPRRPGEPGVAHSGRADPEPLTFGVVGANILELVVGQLLFAADLQVRGLGAPSEDGVNEFARYLAALRAGDGRDLLSKIWQLMLKLSVVLRVPLLARALVGMLRMARWMLRATDRLRWFDRAWLRKPFCFVLAKLRVLARLGFDLLDSTAFEVSQAAIAVDLMLTIWIGLLRENVLSGDADWFALDELDYRDWLRKHGARAETAESPPLSPLADATFADARQHGSGAGTTLHLTLRMLLQYKRAIMFKFAAGMGDTVIAPLYRVLKARGVRFEFFHRIDKLVPASAGGEPIVGAIRFRRQAKLRDPERGYEPLERFSDGMLCFPKSPDYAQLVEGEQLSRGEHDLESAWNSWDAGRPAETLEWGRDFDCVVLGISVGALSSICAELAADAESRPPPARGSAHAPTLSRMLREVATVETMAVQLWLKPSFAALGAPSKNGIGVNYPQPFDTWAEMEHLLTRERWPDDAKPGTLVYLCSAVDEPYGYVPPPVSDRDHPGRQLRKIKRTALHWLDQFGGSVFRNVEDGARHFGYEQLVDPGGGAGKERFESQFYCATTHPSDRYVLSLPGTTWMRLRPHESGFHNLVFTGDWTLNAISAGCVEAAVISGREASRALIGHPVAIAGDWLTRVHPELCSTPMLPQLPIGELEQTAAGPADSPSAPRALPAAGPPFPAKEQSGVVELQPHRPHVPPIVESAREAYFRRPLDMIPRPQYVCRETCTDWFFFHAREAALQALCDELLNHEASPTQYTPLAPLVAFVAARLGRTYANTERIGYIPEKDFAFWIPVKAVAKKGREAEHVASPMAWLQPCLWVDSCPAVVGGREVYGVNKVLGALRVPTQDSPMFSIDTIAIPRQGPALRAEEPTELAQMNRILELEVDPAPGLFDHAQSLFNASEALRLAAHVALEGLGQASWLEALWKQFEDQSIPLVALKMFPDVRDAERVCYKAVVEAPSRPISEVAWHPRP
ncbi:MAG TPA: NAD(P)-binding protein, partial [Polyangiaceae bacterium]|nr:NAD(P)-binding protein [Polyangiaceae bacterium]